MIRQQLPMIRQQLPMIRQQLPSRPKLNKAQLPPRAALLFILCTFAAAILIIANHATASPLMNQPPYLQTGFSLLHPVERIVYSKEWRKRSQRSIARNSHAWIILNLGNRRCATLSSTAKNVTYYQFLPVFLDTPSDNSGHPGWFYETLLPRNDISCKESPFVLAEWIPSKEGSTVFSLKDSAEQTPGIDQVEVQIHFDGHFIALRRPFYMGLSNSFLLQGHCDKYCPMEAELGQRYSEILKSHHLSPYHHWISVPPIQQGRLNLDHKKNQGQSFRQQVMNDNSMNDGERNNHDISNQSMSNHGMIAFPRAAHHASPIEYLQALEQTVQEENLAGRAWVYVKDEPQNITVLAEELRRYRTYAPSVLTMVTTSYQAELKGLTDIFVPVFNRLAKQITKGNRFHDQESYRRTRIWSYPSCMGSCGPNRRDRTLLQTTPGETSTSPTRPHRAKDPGPNTRLPDFLIDRPVERLWLYFQTLDDLRANGGLYYHAVEGYPLIRQGINIIADPWNFGGNGDGLLLYPGLPGQWGLKQHQPLPSFRLKLIRYALEQWWS